MGSDAGGRRNKGYDPQKTLRRRAVPKVTDGNALTRMAAFFRSVLNGHWIEDLNADQLDGRHASEFCQNPAVAPQDMGGHGISNAGNVAASNITASGDIEASGDVIGDDIIARNSGVHIYKAGQDIAATVQAENITASRAHQLPDADAVLVGVTPSALPLSSGRVVATSGSVGLIRTTVVAVDAATGNVSGIGTLSTSGAVTFGGVATGVTPTSGSHLATKDYVDAIGAGITWLPPVLASQTTPPGGPSTGDRYRVTATAAGAWATQEDDIATWNGAAWTFYTPSAGDTVYDLGAGVQLNFDGSAWSVIGANVTDHGALSGLGDDDHPQYAKKAGDTFSGDIDMDGHDVHSAGLIDGDVLCAQTSVQTDSIVEKTTDAGVTIDGVVMKDGEVDGVNIAARDADLATAEGEINTLQSDLDTAEASLSSHVANTSNPHSTTKTHVGLGNVSNDAQLKIASNLADLASASAARANLALGNSAIRDVGTGSGEVAAGNHSHSNADGTTPGYMTAAHYTKLDGIEALADVTDAANVAAALIATDANDTATTGDDEILVRSGGAVVFRKASNVATYVCSVCGG